MAQTRLTTDKMNWQIIHWQGFPGAPDESCALRDNFNLKEYYDVFHAGLEYLLKSSSDTQNLYVKHCESLIYDLQSPRSRTSLLIQFYALRNIARTKDILAKIQVEKKSLLEACSPYLASGWADYINMELYIATQNRVQPLFLKVVIDHINAVKKSEEERLSKSSFGYYSSYSSNTASLHFGREEFSPLIRYLIYIDDRLQKQTHLYHRDLKTIILALLKQSTDPTFHFKELFKLIPSHYWLDLSKDILADAEFLSFLFQKELFQEFLLEFSKLENAGTLLLETPSLLDTCINYISNIDQLSNCLKNLRLNQDDPTFTKAKLDARQDYFKVLLMKEFDYKLCLTKFMRNFDQYQSEISLILFEALSRGDKLTAESIIKATQEHKIAKIKNQYSFTHFGNTEQGGHRDKINNTSETTSFTESIGFSIQAFLKYIAQKAEITGDKTMLFFIANVDEFINILKAFDLVKDATSISKLCQKYGATPSAPSTTTSSDEITELRDEINHLKRKFSESQADNAELQKEVKALRKEMDAFKAFMQQSQSTANYRPGR